MQYGFKVGSNEEEIQVDRKAIVKPSSPSELITMEFRFIYGNYFGEGYLGLENFVDPSNPFLIAPEAQSSCSYNSLNKTVSCGFTWNQIISLKNNGISPVSGNVIPRPMKFAQVVVRDTVPRGSSNRTGLSGAGASGPNPYSYIWEEETLSAGTVNSNIYGLANNVVLEFGVYNYGTNMILNFQSHVGPLTGVRVSFNGTVCQIDEALAVSPYTFSVSKVSGPGLCQFTSGGNNQTIILPFVWNDLNSTSNLIEVYKP